jgi:hypothetical protein
MSINQITKLCRVSEHTVRAVRDREAISIAERKQRLMSIFGNVAESQPSAWKNWQEQQPSRRRNDRYRHRQTAGISGDPQQINSTCA